MQSLGCSGFFGQNRPVTPSHTQPPAQVLLKKSISGHTGHPLTPNHRWTFQWHPMSFCDFLSRFGAKLGVQWVFLVRTGQSHPVTPSHLPIPIYLPATQATHCHPIPARLSNDMHRADVIFRRDLVQWQSPPQHHKPIRPPLCM